MIAAIFRSLRKNGREARRVDSRPASSKARREARIGPTGVRVASSVKEELDDSSNEARNSKNFDFCKIRQMIYQMTHSIINGFVCPISVSFEAIPEIFGVSEGDLIEAEVLTGVTILVARLFFEKLVGFYSGLLGGDSRHN